MNWIIKLLHKFKKQKDPPNEQHFIDLQDIIYKINFNPIGFYKSNCIITTPYSNVINAIDILKSINESNWEESYLDKSMLLTTKGNDLLLSKWYVDNENRILDFETFYKYLTEVDNLINKVNKYINNKDKLYEFSNAKKMYIHLKSNDKIIKTIYRTFKSNNV